MALIEVNYFVGNETTTDTTSPPAQCHLHIAVIWGYNKNNQANFEKNVQPLLLLTYYY